MSIPDGLTAATPIAVAAIGAASAWGVSVWVNARHRSWKSLAEDIDLAEKIADTLPEHAAWLKNSVALRLKGQAMKDSRTRRDVRQSAWGVIYMVTSMVFLSPGVTMLAYGNHLWIKGIGVFLLLLGMALILFGAYQLLDGAAGGFRIPGLSTLDVYGTKDERKDMESAVVALRRQAIQLPNSLPTVVDNNDLEDE